MTPTTSSPASVSVHAEKRPQPSASCRVYFMAVEHDEETSKLNMVGLNKPQADWWGNTERGEATQTLPIHRPSTKHDDVWVARCVVE